MWTDFEGNLIWAIYAGNLSRRAYLIYWKSSKTTTSETSIWIFKQTTPTVLTHTHSKLRRTDTKSPHIALEWHAVLPDASSILVNLSRFSCVYMLTFYLIGDRLQCREWSNDLSTTNNRLAIECISVFVCVCISALYRKEIVAMCHDL